MKKDPKKKIGRPRNKEGMISFYGFERVAIVLSLYDPARKNGQKHSVAVAQTVELVKHWHPMRRISETGVKRILAAWRPRGSHPILIFKVSTLSQQEIAERYRVQDPLASLTQKNDVVLPTSFTTYGMKVGEKPIYPRHNRKLPKQ